MQMWQIVANLEFVTGFAIDLQTRKPNISPRVSLWGVDLSTASDMCGRRPVDSSGFSDTSMFESMCNDKQPK